MTKKYRAEVVHEEEYAFKPEFMSKLKLGVALLLDGLDLIFANIPVLNTIWDFITTAVLFAMLRNKKLALMSFSEFILPGIPILGQIDAFIPVATILTIIDNNMNRFHKTHFSKMKKVN